jgi:chromosomal replication initiation ATPase DnaA
MSVANLRIPVRVTPAQKARIARLAKKAGLPVGEFLRRAADSHISRHDEEVLDGLIAQLDRSTSQTIAAVDQAIAVIDASNRRIDAMLARRRPRPAGSARGVARTA